MTNVKVVQPEDEKKSISGAGDKYDFLITGEIKLFTRRLDDVTKQFPDVVKIIKTHVKGKEFILDSEVVGMILRRRGGNRLRL